MVRWLSQLLARRRHSDAGGRLESHFPDFPRLYDAPPDVLRRIREVAPDVDLLYLGWGRWYLVRYKPHREHRERARRRLPECLRLLHEWETSTKYKANPGAFRRLYGRYLFWRMVELGARPIAEYDTRFVRTFGLEAIPDDLRQMEYHLRHTSDQAALEAINGPKEREQALAHAQLADPDRARDAWRFLFTRTHGVTRYDDPDRRRTRSGFTTVAAIGADGQRRSVG